MIEKLEPQFEQIHYSPLYKSKNQLKYFEKRYKCLARKFKTIRWSENFELTPGDRVLSWDSSDEIKIFGNQILPHQNRLFDQLPFDCPEGFTPFREKVEALLPEIYEDAVCPFDKEIDRELHYYFCDAKLARSYFETRNGLMGRNYSTKFSAYLSSGDLHVQYLYNQIRRFEKKNESNKSTYWIIFELLWREFFYWHYQKHQTEYFSENGIIGSKNFSNFEKYTIEEALNWDTPDFFKACLNEMKTTGFLSNRARQIFASLWINELQLNWRSGAKLFEENLIDYDVYSNYGNWMYLAGVGVDPRGKRIFNLEKQLKAYDPEGNYIRFWLEQRDEEQEIFIL